MRGKEDSNHRLINYQQSPRPHFATGISQFTPTIALTITLASRWLTRNQSRQKGPHHSTTANPPPRTNKIIYQPTRTGDRACFARTQRTQKRVREHAHFHETG